MLIWVVALHCEAKPIIDYYRLKKSNQHSAFDLYQNTQMQCIITGIGKIQAAAATAWIAALNHEQPSLAWINLGIAGAASHSIGELFWLNKIADSQNDKLYFPIPTFEVKPPSVGAASLDQPSSDYRAEDIYDMEASAFFATATRFSSAELVHCLKIISDNHQEQIEFDKARVSQLIQNRISDINEFAQQLQSLNNELIEQAINIDCWQRLMRQAHFSQTQQAQLRSLLGFLSHAETDDQLFELVSGLNDSRSIIDRLQQHSHQLSRNL